MLQNVWNIAYDIFSWIYIWIVKNISFKCKSKGPIVIIPASTSITTSVLLYDDVVAWKCFSHHWSSNGHQSPMDSLPKRTVMWNLYAFFVVSMSNILSKQLIDWALELTWPAGIIVHSQELCKNAPKLNVCQSLLLETTPLAPCGLTLIPTSNHLHS